MASADALTGRIDALAEALRAAGVAPERMAALLGSAAEATMHALVLDAVLDENAAAPAPAVPAPDRQPVDVEQPVRLAA